MMLRESSFPTINWFTEACDSVYGRDEFIVIEKDGYKIIDYVFVLPDSFDDPMRAECRGLKFYDDGRIMSRPLHKFFNVGEKEHTQPQRISMKEPHVLMEKLDGSMVHAARLCGQVVLMTRKGRSDIAKTAEGLLTERNITFLNDIVSNGLTPIFEFTSPENRIVLSYDEPALTLLAIRHNVEGYYLYRSDLRVFARQGGFPVVERFEAKTNDMGHFVHHVREETGIEGYVIGFESGFHVSREKDIIGICLDQGLDDFLPLLEPEDRDLLMNYSGEVARSLILLSRIVKDIVSSGEHLDQKTFAVEHLPSCTEDDNRMRSLCFAERSGKEGAAIRMLKKMKPDEIRAWIPVWPDFPDFNTALEVAEAADYIGDTEINSDQETR
jgi:RNA ligase